MSWTYVVKPGDTPFSIAQRYLGNGNLWRQIWKGDPSHMGVGVHITLPGAGASKQPAAAKPQPPKPASPDATWNQLSTAGQDQATQIVQQFMASLGWPHGFDTQAAANFIVDNHLENDPMAAFGHLYSGGPGMNNDLRSQYPGAFYGMAATDYASAHQKLSNSWRDITGQDIPDDVLHSAIQQRWSTSDMQAYAAHNKDLVADQPWLTEGDTYRNVASQWQQAYGSRPTDVKAMSAWYRFRQSAASVAGGQGAAMVAVPVGVASSQQRTTQAEVR